MRFLGTTLLPALLVWITAIPFNARANEGRRSCEELAASGASRPLQLPNSSSDPAIAAISVPQCIEPYLPLIRNLSLPTLFGFLRHNVPMHHIRNFILDLGRERMRREDNLSPSLDNTRVELIDLILQQHLILVEPDALNVESSFLYRAIEGIGVRFFMIYLRAYALAAIVRPELLPADEQPSPEGRAAFISLFDALERRLASTQNRAAAYPARREDPTPGQHTVLKQYMRYAMSIRGKPQVAAPFRWETWRDFEHMDDTKLERYWQHEIAQAQKEDDGLITTFDAELLTDIFARLLGEHYDGEKWLMHFVEEMGPDEMAARWKKIMELPNMKVYEEYFSQRESITAWPGLAANGRYTTDQMKLWDLLKPWERAGRMPWKHYRTLNNVRFEGDLYTLAIAELMLLTSDTIEFNRMHNSPEAEFFDRLKVHKDLYTFEAKPNKITDGVEGLGLFKHLLDLVWVFPDFMRARDFNKYDLGITIHTHYSNPKDASMRRSNPAYVKRVNEMEQLFVLAWLRTQSPIEHPDTSQPDGIDRRDALNDKAIGYFNRDQGGFIQLYHNPTDASGHRVEGHGHFEVRGKFTDLFTERRVVRELLRMPEAEFRVYVKDFITEIADQAPKILDRLLEFPDYLGDGT